MAILDAEQLAELRNDAAHASVDANGARVGVSWTKAPINAAFQALEDWFEAERSNLVAVLNTATAPLVLTGAQKKRVIAAYIAQKTGRER